MPITPPKPSLAVTLLRLMLALVLMFVVSVVNGLAGLGYLVGGSVASGFAADADDPRWVSEATGRRTPKDKLAALDLLLDSPTARFGLFLQLLATAQFLVGLVLAFRSSCGPALTGLLMLVGLLGATAEVAGASRIGPWGLTNGVGVLVSTGLVWMAYAMYRRWVLEQRL